MAPCGVPSSAGACVPSARGAITHPPADTTAINICIPSPATVAIAATVTATTTRHPPPSATITSTVIGTRAAAILMTPAIIAGTVIPAKVTIGSQQVHPPLLSDLPAGMGWPFSFLTSWPVPLPLGSLPTVLLVEVAGGSGLVVTQPTPLTGGGDDGNGGILHLSIAAAFTRIIIVTLTPVNAVALTPMSLPIAYIARTSSSLGDSRGSASEHRMAMDNHSSSLLRDGDSTAMIIHAAGGRRRTSGPPLGGADHGLERLPALSLTAGQLRATANR